MTKLPDSRIKRRFGKSVILGTLLALMFSVTVQPGWTQETVDTSANTDTSANGGLNGNTGIASNSIIGNGNQQADNVGVAVNGDVDGNLNNNQNNLSSRNQNLLYSPASGGGGGNSALVLPRNPLPLPNANLGRSNFGLQFGLQNNPVFSALSGNGNALGWFVQGGLTIPFGKIPEVYQNRATREVDAVRLQNQENQRNVFDQSGNGNRIERKVEGRLLGLNAYNYTTMPTGKLGLPEQLRLPGTETARPQPHVLTLEPGAVFSRPLDTGEKVGVVEVGQEYPYLGHIRSGWVKILLPDGKNGWTQAAFEYLKHDYTEIDNLASRSADKTRASAQ